MLLRRSELLMDNKCYNYGHCISWFKGTELKDSSRYGKRNSVVMNNISVSDFAYYFINNATSYVQFYNSIFASQLNSKWSLCCWVYRNQNDRDVIFGDPSYMTNIEFNSSDVALVRFYWNQTEQKPSMPVPLKSWHHLCFTSTAQNATKSYLDGTLKWNYTSSRTSATDPTLFRWGYDNRTTTGFGGYMYDMRVYDYGLSADEVKTVYEEFKR